VQRLAAAPDAAAVVFTTPPSEQPASSLESPTSVEVEAVPSAGGTDSFAEVRTPPVCTKHCTLTQHDPCELCSTLYEGAP
jgi:hypothetical protein